MRKFFGQIGGWAFTLALIVPAYAPAATAEATNGFVRFAAPGEAIQGGVAAPVQLVSCCSEGCCAAPVCQAPGCDSCCSNGCDSGCCDPTCGVAGCCDTGCCSTGCCGS